MSDRKTIGERVSKVAERNMSGKAVGKQEKAFKKPQKNTLIEELSKLKVRLDALSVKSDALIVQNSRNLFDCEILQGPTGE